MAAPPNRGKPPVRSRRRAPARVLRLSFEAPLQASGPAGRWTHLEVPAELLEGQPTRGPLAVKGTLDAVEVAAELVPDGRGVYCLAVDAGLRQALGKGAGEPVAVVLEAGAARRAVEVPADLSEAIAANAKAREAFEGWNSLDREACVRFVEASVDPASRGRRIAQAVERIARQRPFA